MYSSRQWRTSGRRHVSNDESDYLAVTERPVIVGCKQRGAYGFNVFRPRIHCVHAVTLYFWLFCEHDARASSRKDQWKPTNLLLLTRQCQIIGLLMTLMFCVC